MKNGNIPENLVVVTRQECPDGDELGRESAFLL